MSTYSKVIWYEGMFLRPHHYQQQDRYFETLINARCDYLQVYDWGIVQLILDPQALHEGKIAVHRCLGLLPDGTPIDIPAEDDPPTPLVIESSMHGHMILLALPDRKPTGEIEGDNSQTGTARFRIAPQKLQDYNAGFKDREEEIKIGRKQFQLITDKDNAGGYSVLRIARVREKIGQGVVLDENFIPPTLDCRSPPLLYGYLTDILELLKQAGQELNSRIPENLDQGRGQIEDLLMLQIINRNIPLFAHLAGMQRLHPEVFYQKALQLAGELATLTRKPRLAPDFPLYDHDDLHPVFLPLMEALRRFIPSTSTPSINELLIKIFGGGRYLAPLSEAQRALLDESAYVLMVKIPPPLIESFPKQCTISAAEELDDLVNRIIPGIGLSKLNTVPQFLPYAPDHTYFRLEQNSEYWQRLKTSKVGLAFHVAVDVPGIVMRLWAIKEKNR